MATDNEYLLVKLKDHRNFLRRHGQVHQALGISSVIKAVKKFPLPIISIKVAELIQGVGKSYAELIGKWLADRPQKRRASEEVMGGKVPKVAYPPGSPEWVVLMCALHSSSPFQEPELHDAFTNVVSQSYIGDFPDDVKSLLHTLVNNQDAQIVEGGFSLTTEGARTAKELAAGNEYRRASTQSTQCEEPIPDPDSWFEEELQVQSTADSSVEPGEITLFVDTAERLTDDFAYFSTQLQNRGVKVEKQKLWIGDYHWVLHPANSDTLYSLGVIVERKAAQDLAASIVDGRYQAQKRRIKDSGIHCIYLLEGTTPSKFQMISHDSLINAITSTMLKYDFQVKVTRNVHDTINWLGRMTTALSHHRVTEGKLVPFEEFQEATNPARTATLRTVFGRQLRSVPACGAQATEAVLRQFATPRELYQALNQGKTTRARKKVLKSIVLDTGTKLQKRVAENLLELFTEQK